MHGPAIGDQCDRHPSARAMTAWYNPASRGLIVLCAHDAQMHELALIAQGFELSMDDRDSLTEARLVVAE